MTLALGVNKKASIIKQNFMWEAEQRNHYPRGSAVLRIILCWHLYGHSWVRNKFKKAWEHLQVKEYTAQSETRQGGGVVWGQRTRIKKNKVQMSQKEVGMEMQIEKKGDSGHNIAMQPRKEQAKGGLADQSRFLSLLPPQQTKAYRMCGFLIQIPSYKWPQR